MNSNLQKLIKILNYHYTNYVIKGDKVWAEEILVNLETGESFAQWCLVTRENVFEFLGY